MPNPADCKGGYMFAKSKSRHFVARSLMLAGLFVFAAVDANVSRDGAIACLLMRGVEQEDRAPPSGVLVIWSRVRL